MMLFLISFILYSCKYNMILNINRMVLINILPFSIIYIFSILIFLLRIKYYIVIIIINENIEKIQLSKKKLIKLQFF
jgi:hypothetical protein